MFSIRAPPAAAENITARKGLFFAEYLLLEDDRAEDTTREEDLAATRSNWRENIT
jgi:hypothetical protein